MKHTTKNLEPTLKPDNRGGARPGSGPKKKTTENFTLSLEPAQMAAVDAYRAAQPKPPTRSQLYSQAMAAFLIIHQ